MAGPQGAQAFDLYGDPVPLTRADMGRSMGRGRQAASELDDAYKQGRADAGSSSSGGRTSSSASSPSSGLLGRARSSVTKPPGVVNEGAGFVLGVIVYALVLNYVKGGPQAVRGWLGAKFLNKPYTGPGSTPPTTGPPLTVVPGVQVTRGQQ